MTGIRKWTTSEVERVHSAYTAVTGRSWDGDVEAAATANSTAHLRVTIKQWDAIGETVGSRTGKQCIDRFRTEYIACQLNRKKPTATGARSIDAAPYMARGTFRGMSDAAISDWARERSLL